jgi:ABC-type phosphate/phosphonate transport system substrate-binding protein
MIANARMYAVSPSVAAVWRTLLEGIVADTGLSVAWLDHAAPQPLEELWNRNDMAAVFMCGLPFAQAQPQPVLVAAPVPSPVEFGGEARYWSDFVVRADSGHRCVADAFGGRLALTVPGSQSGCVAALTYLQAVVPTGHGMDARGDSWSGGPLFSEIIAPTITPLGALSAVIRGDADIAPIDSYAFALLRAHRPDLTALARIVGRTAPTPIPPLVASREFASEPSCAEAIATLSRTFDTAHLNPAWKPFLDQLLLRRFVKPDPSLYAELRDRHASALHFWRAQPLAAVTHPAFAW